jgi:peptidoglycan/LPS O-acetylase OafA/YrhL
MLLFFVAGVNSLDWRTTAVNIALLGTWTGNATPTLWFVEVLLFFQLSFAAWLAFGPLRQWPWSIPILLGTIVTAGGTVAWALGFAPDPRLVLYLPAFAGGAVCGEVLESSDAPAARNRGLLVRAVVTVGVAALVSVLPIWRDLPVTGLVTSLLTTLVVCAVVATLPSADVRSERPNWRPVSLC